MAAQNAQARRFKKAVLDAFVLGPGEVVVLEEAAAMLAEIVAMEAELAGAEVVTKGSRGQPVAHPLVAELRAHRLAFAALVHRLRLPEVDAEGEKKGARASQARRAALARWHGGPA